VIELTPKRRQRLRHREESWRSDAISIKMLIRGKILIHNVVTTDHHNHVRVRSYGQPTLTRGKLGAGIAARWQNLTKTPRGAGAQSDKRAIPRYFLQ
jgi:hypothetical protein